MKKSKNIRLEVPAIQTEQQEKLLGQRGLVLWFTGLSGSGKTTLAKAVAKSLYEHRHYCVTLDGDNLRHGLCADLGFSDSDRGENIRRIGEVAKLFADNAAIVLCSFISPFAKDRDAVREKLGSRYVEIFVDCSIEECAKRDPKGLYQKVHKGQIKQFTGKDSNYEIPTKPDLHLQTDKESLEDCLRKVEELVFALIEVEHP